MSNGSQAASSASKRGPGRPPKAGGSAEAITAINRAIDEAPSNPPGHEEQHAHQYFCGSVPVSGKCYRVRIIANGNELRFPKRVPLQLGDLPTIRVLANVEVILPEEYVSLLRDTTVEVPRGGNYSEGEPLAYETLVRIPHAILGTATWEEYQEFRAKDARKPIVIEKQNPYLDLNT